MQNELSFEEKSVRVLAVIYKMANGSCDVEVKKVDLLNEVNRSGVMQMSAEEFENYRQSIVKTAHSNTN